MLNLLPKSREKGGPLGVYKCYQLHVFYAVDVAIHVTMEFNIVEAPALCVSNFETLPMTREYFDGSWGPHVCVSVAVIPVITNT